MTLNNNISAPDEVTILLNLKQNIFRSLNVCKPGKIISFDSATKTAQVQIQDKFIMDDGSSIKSYPPLVDCPVFTLQGGGANLTMPVKAGDPCLILFSDRNLDNWFSTGSEAAPATFRCHDLSDGIAFVGISSLQDSTVEYYTNEVRLSYLSAFFGLKGGKTAIQNTTYDLLTALTNLINGLQGATAGGKDIVDATGKIATALTQLQGLLYKD